MKRCLLFGLAAAFTLSLAASAQAHPIFAKTVKEEYGLASVSCKACHVNTKKEEHAPRNDFGKVVNKLTEGKNIEKRLDEVKEKDQADKDKVNAEIRKEFVEMLKTLAAQKAANGKTYGDIIKAAELEGLKAE